MSHDATQIKLRNVLRDLPIEHQLFEVVAAIVAENPGAVSVSLRMIGAVEKMSEDYSTENRFIVAERLRSASDRLERRQAMRVV